MAIQGLANGAYGPGCQWSVDWDDTARNIGVTVSGTPSEFFVEIDLQAGTFVADCMHGPASSTPDPITGNFLLGNIIGQGRAVVIGPGSLIGHTAPVNNANWKTNILAIGTRETP